MFASENKLPKRVELNPSNKTPNIMLTLIIMIITPVVTDLSVLANLGFLVESNLMMKRTIKIFKITLGKLNSVLNENLNINRTLNIIFMANNAIRTQIVTILDILANLEFLSENILITK